MRFARSLHGAHEFIEFRPFWRATPRRFALALPFALPRGAVGQASALRKGCGFFSPVRHGTDLEAFFLSFRAVLHAEAPALRFHARGKVGGLFLLREVETSQQNVDHFDTVVLSAQSHGTCRSLRQESLPHERPWARLKQTQREDFAPICRAQVPQTGCRRVATPLRRGRRTVWKNFLGVADTPRGLCSPRRLASFSSVRNSVDAGVYAK